MGDSSRRLAAIMFTDMVGYSALAHKNEELADDLLIEQKSLLDPVLERTHGRVIKSTGDGFLIEFSSAQQAFQCALQFQSDLSTRNIANPEEKQINVRIGIHLGEVEERDGDIYGDGVNIAARIEPLASVGGIAISSHVLDQMRGKFRIEFSSLGLQNLRNINTPIEVFQVSIPVSDAEMLKNAKPAFFSKTAVRLGTAAGIIAILIIVGWFALRSSTPNIPEEPTLAVLPFIDMSPGGDNEYLADGISEELINVLTRLEGVKVISRTSSFAFKGTNETIKTIAEKIGTDLILEGSIRSDNETLRVTVQLIKADDETHIWSETYDLRFDGILKLQEEISNSVAERLGKEFESLPATTAGTSTSSDEAYNLYLQGLFHRKKWNSLDRLNLAIDYFNRAIEVDQQFALAYSGLAESYLFMGDGGFLHPDEANRLATENALIALDLDPNLAEGHFVYGLIQYEFTRDAETAVDEIEKALELNPNNDEAYYIYAQLLHGMGRLNEAIDAALQAVEIDVFSTTRRNLAARYLVEAKRDQEASIQYEKSLELDPEQIGAMIGLAKLEMWHGNWDESNTYFQRAREIDPDDPHLLGEFATSLTHQGLFDRAEPLFQRAIEVADKPLGAKFDYALFKSATRQYEDVLSIMHEVIESQPNNPFYSLLEAYAHYYLSNYEVALSKLDISKTYNNDVHMIALNLHDSLKGVINAQMGDKDAAESVLNGLIEREESPDRAISIAQICVALNNLDCFFEWMNRSYQMRDPGFISIKWNNLMTEARSDPRFDEMLALIGLD